MLAPLIAPYNPDDLGYNALSAPSFTHFFGTDDYGRDIFSRILFGARVSLSVGVVSVSLAIVIGVFIGAISGFFGGRLDSVLMRFVDVMMSFPSIFLILAVQAAFKPNIFNVMAVIGLTSWMGVSRLLRAEVLSQKERLFVESAKAAGASNSRLIFVHILPNSLAPVIVAATLGVAGAIMTESALSFLGLGVQPPFASWGNMLQDSQAYMFDAPWMSLMPGIMITLTVLSIYIFGESLREAMNPRGN